MKKRSLALGILLGITVVVSLGIVYIDTIQNYWYVNGGFVKLIVSNQTAQAIMTVDTNTMRVGFNTNNTARSFVVKGRKPATVATGNGTTAATTGAVILSGGDGGDTAATTSAGSGIGGATTIVAGEGGNAVSAVTNATAGNGGVLNLLGGAGGGSAAGVATNASTAGNGGVVNVQGGNGGVPVTASTNTTGGNGGAVNFSTGGGGTPTAGFTRTGGNGGNGTFTAGDGGNSTRTSSGTGGNMSFTAGNSGSALVTPGSAAAAGGLNFTAGNSGSAVAGGNPSPGGNVNVTAGNGSTGDTNSDGGHVFIAGGAPGSGAVPGHVVLARTSAGTSRGAGVQIGPLIAGGSATITNVLGGVLALDFPSTAAGTVSDLPIAVTGVTSNNCAVSLSVPWQSTFGNGGVFSTFNSNDAVYVRFANNNLVAAIDPVPGDFTVVVFRIR